MDSASSPSALSDRLKSGFDSFQLRFILLCEMEKQDLAEGLMMSDVGNYHSGVSVISETGS